jgi:hypothetical protein
MHADPAISCGLNLNSPHLCDDLVDLDLDDDSALLDKDLSWSYQHHLVSRSGCPPGSGTNDVPVLR